MNSWDSKLLAAAKAGDLAAAKAVLEAGADANAHMEAGVTPLHSAAAFGYLDVVRLLVEHKADVNAKTENGWMPLHRAAWVGRPDIARLLIERGADVRAKDTLGRSPLHFAAESGSADVAHLLLDADAEVNATDSHGSTPLHVAAREGRVDAARLLIERGADLGVRNNRDATPIDEIWCTKDKQLRDAKVLLVILGAQGLSPFNRYEGKTLLQHFARVPAAKPLIKEAQRQWKARVVGEAIANGFAGLVEAPSGTVYQPAAKKRELAL